MNFISLFSGIGGFDLGFEEAGMNCVGQVEIDKNCQWVLARRWPKVPKHANVRTFHYGEPVDLICGGFPCQDVSVAGQRAGLAGERSGLWHEFHRIVASARPRWVVVENVPGLLSSNEGRDFAVILRGLVECGYGVAWRILDPQYFGVAQRRRRVFIVGSLGDGRAAAVLFERDSGPWDSPPRREAGATVAPTINSGANRTGGTRPPGTNVEEAETLQVIAFTERSRAEGRTFEAQEDIAYALTNPGSGGRTHSRMIAYGLSSHHQRNNHEADYVVARPLANSTTINHYDESQQTYIAFDPLMAGSERTFIHRKNGKAQLSGRPDAISYPIGVRRLTTVECERLQGFPDGWTAEQTDSVRYRQLGNAVCVPVAEWIGRRIVEAAQ